MFNIYRRYGKGDYRLRGGAWHPRDAAIILARLRENQPTGEFILIDGKL